jgi:hypothetical protein
MQHASQLEWVNDKQGSRRWIKAAKGKRGGLGLTDQVRPTRLSRTIHIAHTKRKSARDEENNEDGIGQVEDEDDGIMGTWQRLNTRLHCG